MTSGNLTEEPIAAENDEARERLGSLADALVLHNRDIYARYDDSVWFVPYIPLARDGRRRITREREPHVPQPVRRARAYAPFPVKLPFRMDQILACGPEIKNTFCLTRDEYAFVSQHIGDMENLETLEHFERTVDLYQRLFRIQPRVVAVDLHPGYIATRHGLERAAREDLQVVSVQHHHAHLVACLADNDWQPTETLGGGLGDVIGVSLDGTGYGEDGHIWGGEWLVGGYRGYRRAAQLEYLPLPGGDAATRHPWRIAFSYIYTLLGRVPEFDGVEAAQAALLRQQIDRRINCPLTSSMGRLFDAVSALLGVCTRTSYEAQAAIELEMAATRLEWFDGPRPLRVGDLNEGYPYLIEATDGPYMIHVADLFRAVQSDLSRGVPVFEIAWRFHATIARMTVEGCVRIAADTGIDTVAISGGCFQNRLLLALAVPALEAAGFRVLQHRRVPCNDGGLSLGQAVIARFRIER
jgi:hydrogenase maturation protein HypF